MVRKTHSTLVTFSLKVCLLITKIMQVKVERERGSSTGATFTETNIRGESFLIRRLKLSYTAREKGGSAYLFASEAER